MSTLLIGLVVLDAYPVLEGHLDVSWDQAHVLLGAQGVWVGQQE